MLDNLVIAKIAVFLLLASTGVSIMVGGEKNNVASTRAITNLVWPGNCLAGGCK